MHVTLALLSGGLAAAQMSLALGPGPAIVSGVNNPFPQTPDIGTIPIITSQVTDMTPGGTFITAAPPSSEPAPTGSDDVSIQTMNPSTVTVLPAMTSALSGTMRPSIISGLQPSGAASALSSAMGASTASMPMQTMTMTMAMSSAAGSGGAGMSGSGSAPASTSAAPVQGGAGAVAAPAWGILAAAPLMLMGL